MNTKITGYRNLLQDEIDQMNACKAMAVHRNLLQDEIDQMNACKAMAVQVGALCDSVAKIPGVDQRWVAIGRTDLQKGFMALIRGIAKPETF